MLRFALALALAALPLASVSAQAADIRNIGCVQENVTPETLRVLRADVEKNFNDLDNQSYSEGAISGFRAAGQICRGKFGWNDKVVEASILYALSNLAQPVARQRAGPAKLDYGALERRFAALTRAEQIDAMQEQVLNKLAVGALDAKEMNETNAKLAGGIFGLLAVHAKAINDFTVN
ncbi:MAG: hypothetical protein EOP60_10520 [Sphingomonadales bacterium]|nr:MAG: hypothetical protein EOP60_10520 [Sphingomonadales bacterium]